MSLEMLFAKVLGTPVEQIDDALSMDTNKRWDSLKHLEIVTAIEHEYKIKLAAREIYNLKTFAQAKTLLQKRRIDL